MINKIGQAIGITIIVGGVILVVIAVLEAVDILTP